LTTVRNHCTLLLYFTTAPGPWPKVSPVYS
jgi:hypothetical protein